MGALFYNQSPVSPETGTDQPHNLQIIATYPNPFNSSLNIRVYAAKTSNVSLSIWNVEGQQIAQIWQGTLQSGINQFNWSAEHIPSGVYLVRLQAGETVQIQRCILLK